MAEEIKPIPKLRTFEADIEKFGAIRPPYKERESFSIRKIIFIAILSFVVIGIIYLIVNLIKKPLQQEEVVPQTQIGQPFLKGDTETKLIFSTLDSGSIIKAMLKEKDIGRKIGTITFLPTQLTIREFFELTDIGIPESILQNTFPEFNIFAVYGRESSDLVFIIKNKNFEKAYSSMLSWETTMWTSFKPFLNPENVSNIGRFSFVDEIVRNHDSRVLKNNDNESILAYTIFNKQFIVISTSADSLSTILQRLIASPPK